MKKIIICFLILAVAVGVTVGYLKYEDSKLYTANGVFTPKPLKNITTFTVTAAGDCTFGTDENYISDYSFDAEYARNNENCNYFLENVRKYFENDDLSIINFEGTLSDRGVRAEKEYAFRGTPFYVDILTSSFVEAANLSNNHSRDYGEESLFDTKNILGDSGILLCEGENVGVEEVNGKTIGLIGTNALSYNEAESLSRRMDKLKSYNPDLIIASFHWGTERKYTPDDAQIKLAHQAIDNGADLVIGHHPHVLQGIEKYKGKYILYSLGNFCFGGHNNPVDKDTMLFRQTFVFEEGELTEDGNAVIVPCSISSVKDRNNYQPTPLKGSEFERVKKKITDLCAGFEGIENVTFFEEGKDSFQSEITPFAVQYK